MNLLKKPLGFPWGRQGSFYLYTFCKTKKNPQLFPTQLHFWSLLLPPLYQTPWQLPRKQLLSPQRQNLFVFKSWSVQERKWVFGKIWLPSPCDSPPAPAIQRQQHESNPRAGLTYTRWQWTWSGKLPAGIIWSTVALWSHPLQPLALLLYRLGLVRLRATTIQGRLKAPICWDSFICHVQLNSWGTERPAYGTESVPVYFWSIILLSHQLRKSSQIKRALLWWSHNFIRCFALELNVTDASQSERSHQEENQPRNLMRYSLLCANGAKIRKKGLFLKTKR